MHNATDSDPEADEFNPQPHIYSLKYTLML
jgi:hypothetical protein